MAKPLVALVDAYLKARNSHRPTHQREEPHLINKLVDLHADDPEFGHRSLPDELVAAGHSAGANRVHRLCRQNRVRSVFAKKRSLV